MINFLNIIILAVLFHVKRIIVSIKILKIIEQAIQDCGINSYKSLCQAER